MAIPQSDSFTGTENPLSTNWATSKQSSACQKANGYAYGSDSGNNSSYWSADSFAADHYSEVVFSAVGDCGMAVRSITSGTTGSHYLCTVKPTYLRVYSYVGTSFTQIGSDVNRTNQTSETFRLTATGGHLDVTVDTVNVFSQDTSTISGGSTGSTASGIWCWDNPTTNQITSWAGGNVGSSGATLIQSVSSGNINVTGLSPNNDHYVRARLIQAVTQGRVNFIGQTPTPQRNKKDVVQGVSSGRLNLLGLSPTPNRNQKAVIQGILSGQIDILGQAPDQNYQSNIGVTALIQGVTPGVLNLLGLSPQNIKYTVTNLLQGVDNGQLVFNGLPPDNSLKYSISTIQGLDNGIVLFNGLDPRDGYSGIALTGKSAASKLALGDYSTVDIWSTPFADYTSKLTLVGQKTLKTLKPTDNVEQIVRDELQQLSVLTDQVDSLLKEQHTNNVKKEITRLRRQEQVLVERIQALKYHILRQEDEEILILTLT